MKTKIWWDFPSSRGAEPRESCCLDCQNELIHHSMSYVFMLFYLTMFMLSLPSYFSCWQHETQCGRGSGLHIEGLAINKEWNIYIFKEKAETRRKCGQDMVSDVNAGISRLGLSDEGDFFIFLPGKHCLIRSQSTNTSLVAVMQPWLHPTQIKMSHFQGCSRACGVFDPRQCRACLSQ